MPSRLTSAENFEPNSPDNQFLVSGKNRDYYTSRYGPGFSEIIINPGGTVVEPGNGYRYHVYLSPVTIEVTGSTTDIDYLVVAGGGAAGGHWSPTPSVGSRGTGGGGAGGMLTGSMILSPGNYPIQVGTGGPGGEFNGSNGGSSKLTDFVTTTGGGGGGMSYWFGPPTAIGPTLFWCQGRPGGSGGGGGTIPSPDPNNNPSAWFTGGTGNTPPTTPPQGNPGGNGGVGSGGGGGGGAGGSGVSYTGPAGIGRTDIRFAAPLIAPAIPAPLRPTWITVVGDLGTYASGGRGNYATVPQGNLTGGGGAGGGSPGHAYTGGGGSGYGFRPGPHGGYPGGSGGSGIVVFRYLI